MEEQYFDKIRAHFCSGYHSVQPGKMMSSEAITFKGKVFAFFSRQQHMVFKLGKDFDASAADIEIRTFSPFKNRAPMRGWFEVPYIAKEHWEPLALQALNTLKNEL